MLHYKPVIKYEDEKGRQEICAVFKMCKSIVMWRYCLALHGNINNITKIFRCDFRKHLYLK